MNSDPTVCYRFEPLLKLRESDRVRALERRIESSGFSGDELSELYSIIAPATLQTHTPPFFKKEALPWRWQRFLRAGSFRVPQLGALYRHLFTPPAGAHLVSKEVSREDLMERVIEGTVCPVVYVVRIPFAVVASRLRSRGGFGERPARCDAILRERAPDLAEQFAGRIEALSSAEKEALLWRADVEYALRVIRDQSSARLVVYEDLCRETARCVSDVFHHFGLEVTEQTRAFIGASTDPRNASAGYYRVFKDPVKSMHAWTKLLDASVIRRIADIVTPSPAFAECAALGKWDEVYGLKNLIPECA